MNVGINILQICISKADKKFLHCVKRTAWLIQGNISTKKAEFQTAREFQLQNPVLEFALFLVHWKSNPIKSPSISANPYSNQIFLVAICPGALGFTSTCCWNKYCAAMSFSPHFPSLFSCLSLWAQLHSLPFSDSSSHPQAAAHSPLFPFLFQRSPFKIHILFDLWALKLGKAAV